MVLLSKICMSVRPSVCLSVKRVHFDTDLRYIWYSESVTYANGRMVDEFGFYNGSHFVVCYRLIDYLNKDVTMILENVLLLTEL